MADRNADASEDERTVFRIGINIGDIITDESDIYGDGVNVAARPGDSGAVLLHDLQQRPGSNRELSDKRPIVSEDQ
jgi:hypothetical protein